MPDESIFDDVDVAPEPPTAEPPEPPSEPVDLSRISLSTAAALLPSEYDGDDGDYEPSPEGTRYRGHLILDRGQWPQSLPAAHARWRHRLYVRAASGTIGLVPWDGSQIVWPWEAAWELDLHRDQVQSLLKTEGKEKK